MVRRKRFELERGIQATVGSAGNISRTRRLTVTRTLLLGPGTLFVPKATKHDDRELYLVIESPEWAEVVNVDPKRQRAARQLAQAITLASTQAEEHHAAFSDRLAEADQHLQEALGSVEETQQAEQALVESDEAHRAHVDEARAALEEVLALVGGVDDRQVKRARKRLVEATAALEVPLAIPPRPDLTVADVLKTPTDDDADEADDEGVEDLGNGPIEPASESGEGTSGGGLKQSGSAPDPFDAIRRLGELRDAGLITSNQFEAKRDEILGRL